MEDQGEDCHAIAAHRDASNRMTGWNGSLRQWRGEHRQAVQCPAHLRVLLDAIKQELLDNGQASRLCTR